jgi:hypothetical protein
LIIDYNNSFIDFKKSFNELELSKETINIIDRNSINLKDIAVGEFSGRDSAAAIIKGMESDDINVVLPIVAFTGTDYGCWKSYSFRGKRSNCGCWKKCPI